MRNDTPENKGGGRDLLHVFGRKADQFQSFLYRRLQVQCGEKGQHKNAVAHPLEERGRQDHENGKRRAGQCGIGVYQEDTARPQHRAMLRYLLRVYAE